jgi:dihydrofolate reductase
MGKLTITTFLTLDGVMQAPGGPEEDTSGGFTRGGWQFPYATDDFIVSLYGRVDAFLLGRRTYEIFAGYWPLHDDPADPIASRLNRLPKYVVSNRLAKADWNDSHVLRGTDLATEITALKKRHANEILIHGSADLAQTLFAQDLIDEYHLLIHPVVLGSGKRLFESGTPPRALSLVASKTTGTGVLINTYEPAGAPTYGSLA